LSQVFYQFHVQQRPVLNLNQHAELITLAKGIMLAKQLDRKSSEGSCKDATCQCQDEVKPNTFLHAGLPSIDASADKATIAFLQQQLVESKEDLTRLEHKLDAVERLKDTLNLEVSQLKAALIHARSRSEQTSESQVYERISISIRKNQHIKIASTQR